VFSLLFRFSLLDLLTELKNFAINLAFGLVADDHFDRLLRFRLNLRGAPLLSLCAQWQAGDHRNRYKQPGPHEGVPVVMLIPSQSSRRSNVSVARSGLICEELPR